MSVSVWCLTWYAFSLFFFAMVTELREHKELFGNETPTEVKRLEECIAELKKAKSHSDGQISNCLEKNKEFDEA